MIIRLFTVLLMVTSGAALANDYPTLERVDHVLTCMRTNGGQTVDNLYACSCEVDIIAQTLPFDDFAEARTFEIYKRMPGEKGGLFRDSDRAKKIVGQLETARAEARKRCFIGMQVKHPEGAKPEVSAAGAEASAKGGSATPAAR